MLVNQYIKYHVTKYVNNYNTMNLTTVVYI